MNLYSEEHKPILYVDAPNFSASSNGIRCLYYIAKDLARCGLDVRFVPRSNRGFLKSLPSLFRDIPVTPSWSLLEGSTILCSESVPARTVRVARKHGIKIIWWYLAPFELLAKQHAKPTGEDEIIVFSSYVVPSLNNKYYFYQPPVDSAWRKALSKHIPSRANRRLTIGLYCGKGVLARMDHDLKDFLYSAEIIPITRSHPSTREGLFKLMMNLDGLISFDELSQLSLESASVGLPVYLANSLFPAESRDQFPMCLNSMVTANAKTFIDLVVRRKQIRKNTMPALDTLFVSSIKTVSDISRMITSQEYKSASENRLLMRSLKAFGRNLRMKGVLSPLYGGQSAGVYLLRLYLLSLKERYLVHRIVCILITLYDKVSAVFFNAGMDWIFSKYLQRLGLKAAIGFSKLIIRS